MKMCEMEMFKKLGCGRRMTAKEMFEKLGYEKSASGYFNRNRNILVCFFSEIERYFVYSAKEEKVYSPYDLSIEELQAIDQQIRELGWPAE